jgi:pimeloyl-ACP methyl ester carboxylesterase
LPAVEYVERFVSAGDGLKLFACDYGPHLASSRAVVCLPGLARTSADFHELALALSSRTDRPRRTLAVDYRGRGRSGYDPDWRRYEIGVELADLLHVLTALGIERAVLIGTSRGGILAMALAAARPNAVAGAVLNDVGPVIERRGLIRIRGYVGKLPEPRDYAEAGRVLKALMSAQFPRLTEAQWQGMARATWKEAGGRLVPDYDRALLRSLDAVDLETPLPSLWPLFDNLKRVPVLAIRGAHSDILSAQTLSAMAAAHPALQAMTIPDQGHAPLTSEPGLIDSIARFVGEVDGERLRTPA